LQETKILSKRGESWCFSNWVSITPRGAFERRHIFDFIDLAFEEGDEKVNQIRQKYDNEYKKYLYQEVKVSGSAYNGADAETIGIKMLMPNGNIVPLDTFSPIIKSLVPSSYKTIERIYYFED
jgi:hypothetical protein